MGRLKRYKWIGAFAGAGVLVLLLRGFAFTSCYIPSNGMENTLFERERIIVNKWSYGLRIPMMQLWSYHRWNNRPVKREDMVVFNNPIDLQEPVIDKREVFINRCIGVPGDTLLIDSLFSIITPERSMNPDKKKLYSYPAEQETRLTQIMEKLGIDNGGLMGSNDSTYVRSFSRYEYYLISQALDEGECWLHPLMPCRQYPLRPIVVPKKGQVIKVHPWNITLLRNTLVLHEKRQAEIKSDTLYIDGKPSQHCYFTQDYYWMESNNAANLSDSRLFGFVPHSHIVGKAACIWFSKEKGSGLFKGYRWNRFFRSIE